MDEGEPHLKDPNLFIENTDMTKGAKISMTFKEGLVVQILPNGDVLQRNIANEPLPKNLTKGNKLVQDQVPDHLVEVCRMVTTEGQIIKHMGNGNFIIYFKDGSIT